MKQSRAWAQAADCFIVLGSSLVVEPAASIPMDAREAGAILVIVNRDSTPKDDWADFNFHTGIAEFFDELFLELKWDWKQ